MKNTGNLKMKNLKPLKELFLSYYKHNLKIFLMDVSYYCLTRFCRKNVFNSLFDKE